MKILFFTLIVFATFNLLTVGRYKLLNYKDCGSQFLILSLKFGEFQLGSQNYKEAELKFIPANYFYIRKLFHLINWYSNDTETDYVTGDGVLCGGQDNCPYFAINFTHTLHAAVTIDEEYSDYGLFKWRVYNKDFILVSCIEAVYQDGAIKNFLNYEVKP